MIKYLFLIPLFLFIGNELNAQDVFKFRAKYYSYKEYSHGRWTDWSEWEDANILIAVDIADQRITIFATETIYLDIYDDEIEEGVGESIVHLYAIDNSGEKCRVRLVYEDDGNHQLYIDYSNLIFTYAIKPLRSY